ncbi:lysostaphin resistance A-like protein [Anoxybacteroides rupiense]|uniref:CPBP family intramembrane glutamic endopeptidase n=1 Tax=Anoxybacteroides rupiense TaxID=311460 RepID=UPI003FA598D9
MSRQSKQIQTMSDREVLRHLYVTQGLLLIISSGLGWFLLDGTSFERMWRWETATVVLYGGGGALLVLALEFLLLCYLPKEWYDDGGINEKLFQTRSLPHLLWPCLVIAFTEEWLFRGVLQTRFGLLVASLIFAVLHVRYLAKWFSFIMVMLLSFFLGYLYAWTGILWVTISAHFFINFVLAVHIRLDYLQAKHPED